MKTTMTHFLASVVFAANTGGGSAKAAAAPAAAKPKMNFSIGEIMQPGSIPLPTAAKRSGNSGVFPYDKLEVGAWFGIKGRTAESMSSTISSANKRFREFDNSFEIGVPTGETDPATGLPATVNKRMCKRFEAFDKKDVKGAEQHDYDVFVFRMQNVAYEPPKPKKGAAPTPGTGNTVAGAAVPQPGAVSSTGQLLPGATG